MISFDASASGSGGGSSSITYSHTVGTGENRAIVVGVFEQSDSVTGVTYNGTSLTQAGVKVRVGSGGGAEYVHLFYLANPDSGANNVVVSRSTSANAFQAYSISLEGVDQNDPLVSTNGFSSESADPADINLETERGDWAFVMARNASATTTSEDSNFSTRFTASSFNLFDSDGATKVKEAYASGTYDGSFTAGSAAKWGVTGASFREARPESAIEMNGSSTYCATSGNFTGYGTSAMTAMVKVKTDSAGAVALVMGVNNGTQETFQVVKAGGNYRFDVHTVNNVSSVTPLANVEDGDWHTLAGRYDGSNVYLFLDGLEVDSDAQTGNIDTGAGAPLSLGGRHSGGPDIPWTGLMKHARIWDVALTDAEILAEHNSATPVKTSGLTFATDCNNNTLDTSGSGNHLTQYGTPEFVADDSDPVDIGDFSDGNWTRRAKLTIDNTKVSGDLTNFPVYVDLNDLPATFFDNLQSAGQDLRVTYNDDKTEMPCEVVAVDTTGDTGELHLVFEEKLFSDHDMEFYIYYGNSGASAYANTHTYGRDNVWGQYSAVYHFQSDVTDSTGNYSAGTERGNPAIATFGLGKGYQFDGSGDGLDLGHIDRIAGVGAMSISMIMQEADVSVDFMLFGQDDIGSADSPQSYMEDGITGLIWAIANVGNRVWFNPNTYLTDNTTHWIHQTFDGSQSGNTNRLKQYVDGSTVTMSNQGTVEATTGANANEMNIGLRNAGTSAFDLNGYMDELRVTSLTLTSDWIATEHDNQNSPGTFYSVGSEESTGGGTPVTHNALFFGCNF